MEESQIVGVMLVPRSGSLTRTIWDQPSPSDFDRWEALVVGGLDPSLAAKELGFAGSSTFKRTDIEKHGEVLAVWRERRDADDVKLARDTLREVAGNPEESAASRVAAATTLGKAARMFDETTSVVVSGRLDVAALPIDLSRLDTAELADLRAILEKSEITS